MCKKYFVILFSVFIIILVVSACVFSHKTIDKGWSFAKKYAIKSEYSRNQHEYLQVYCEDEFNFENEGVLKGSFTLPHNTDYNLLRFQILIPTIFMRTPNGQRNLWHGMVKIPAKLKFTWLGKDGHRKVAETKTYYKSESSSGVIYIEYVALPRNKKIDYILEFEKGEYLPNLDSPALYYYHDATKTSDFFEEDKTELLKTHIEFWKAKFMVLEHIRKGDIDFERKPADE